MSQPPKSDFLRIAQDRGYLYQTTDWDGLDQVMAERAPVPAYIGYDCTAPSLHVGSLVSIMLLRWLQKTGHQPVVLMGGGTTRSAIRRARTRPGNCWTMPPSPPTWPASNRCSRNT